MNNGNYSINHCKGNNCALYIFGFSTWSNNIVSMWCFSYIFFFSLSIHPSDSIPFFTSVEVSSLTLLLSCSWELHFPYCQISSSLSPEVSVSIVSRLPSSVWLHNHTHSFPMECGVVWVVPLWSSSSWAEQKIKGQMENFVMKKWCWSCTSAS